MPLTSDWHIHSRNSCDQASLVVADLAELARRKGIEDFGLTDHLHTPFNLPDVAASRADFLASRPHGRFHFGVEVSCVSRWELDEIAAGRHENPAYGLRSGGPPGGELAVGLAAEDLATHGIEFVVGGAHWPMYVPLERQAVIRDYHRQNLFLARHPLVDVVAHPWWWSGHWRGPDKMYRAEPWFDDFGAIPRALHEEFAAACIEHDAVVEVNLAAILLNASYPQPFKRQYLDYLAFLRKAGVALCIGSDCHDATYQADFDRATEMLQTVGLRDEHFWRLPPRAT